MNKPEHETRHRLLETAIEMLDELPASQVSASEILRRTGIARGSLYHFWDSIGELIDEAYVARYSRYVERSAQVIDDLIASSTSKQELLDGLRKVTQLTQDPARKTNRFEHARIIGSAEKNEKFRQALGKVQQNLTDKFTEQFREGQKRGWFSEDYDPRAAAVFIQAYTLGKIVDDVVENQMDPEAWNNLIELIVMKALTKPD